MKETLDKQITIMQSLTTKIINLNPIVNNNSLTIEDIEYLNNKIITLENKFKQYLLLTCNALGPNGGAISINNNRYYLNPSGILRDENNNEIQKLELYYPLIIQYSINSSKGDYAYLKDNNNTIIIDGSQSNKIILQSGPSQLNFQFLYYGSGGAD